MIAAPLAAAAQTKNVALRFTSATPNRFATASGGGRLNTGATKIAAGQIFVLNDLNGGALEDGDNVRISWAPEDTRSTYWREGDGFLQRVGTKPDESCTFQVKMPDKAAPQAVLLQTASGKFVTVDAKDGALIITAEREKAVAFTMEEIVPTPQDPAKPAMKTFIDYFLPMPSIGPLSKDVWGAATVGPRDQKNGLEDTTLKEWTYWDGQIVKNKDGKFYLFGSRWDQALGHSGWSKSKAIYGVSDSLYGPYVEKGLLWLDNQDGKGHNVTTLQLPDGRYATIVSDTRPGEVFVADSLAGPWKYEGKIAVADSEFGPIRMANLSVMVRPDGDLQIVSRSGAVLISKTGILGPYTVQGPSVFTTVPELKTKTRTLEDPVVWFSGGLYHIIINDWNRRVAYHLTSTDGIKDWTYRGIAYDASKDFIRTSDGTANRWYKYERPGVFIENGHVVAMTFAVVDIAKEEQKGNDGHGSKVIVVPFDGAALDRDLQASTTLDK